VLVFDEPVIDIVLHRAVPWRPWVNSLGTKAIRYNFGLFKKIVATPWGTIRLKKYGEIKKPHPVRGGVWIRR
jgi:hypothetical protein